MNSEGTITCPTHIRPESEQFVELREDRIYPLLIYMARWVRVADAS